jgi:hypothetical protein
MMTKTRLLPRRDARLTSAEKDEKSDGFNGFHPRRRSGERDGRRRGDEDGENASCTLLVFVFL